MTMIVGGKRDLGVRSRQLLRAQLKTLKPRRYDGQQIERLRHRCAAFYSQFETVPVMRHRKKVAEVRGAYLAKIMRHAGGVALLASVVHHIKLYCDLVGRLHWSRKRRPPCIPLSIVKAFETCAEGKS